MFWKSKSAIVKAGLPNILAPARVRLARDLQDPVPAVRGEVVAADRQVDHRFDCLDALGCDAAADDEDRLAAAGDQARQADDLGHRHAAQVLEHLLLGVGQAGYRISWHRGLDQAAFGHRPQRRADDYRVAAGLGRHAETGQVRQAVSGGG